jgi:oxygen-dependent protoporphyrinogen oxidase
VLPRFVTYEREYGSLIRGVRRERRAPQQSSGLFLSFRRGMQALTDSLGDAIADSVDVVHQKLSAVEPVSGGWRVISGGQHSTAKHLALAVPAPIAATLLSNSVPALASELSAIPCSSAILVTVVYRKSDAHIPEGFGFLVPRRERKTIAATTFVGTKWPSRIPPDLVALRAFIVDPEAPNLLKVSNADIIHLVRADFHGLLDITAEPLFSTVERWPESMPQYVVGHEARQKHIENALSDLPGLYLTGNSYSGVGVPDCVRLARETAQKITSPAPVT